MTAILAIDQGTTSSRAIIFDKRGAKLGIGQHEFSQYFPQDGWVEHDPNEIWQTTVQAVKDALAQANLNAEDITTSGITNQRETTVVWDKASGEPIYPAIVWQDRRTASICLQLNNDGHEATIQNKTGLLLDPYFSASKIAWILDSIDGARSRAENGELAFGTIDTFLLWRLSGGKTFATDTTNASRTSLFDINTLRWDEQLLELFNVPAAMLPEVKESGDDYGTIDASLFGHAIPIQSVLGDQQAALFGQACFGQGQAKSTYGTGCFAMVSIGDTPKLSTSRLLTTVAYSLNGQTQYALEGSIFIAGSVMQWLRDGIQIIPNSASSEAIAKAQGSSRGITVVPAFTGLGAPHWDPDARGAILGITRDTSREDIVVACLESVALQTCDLVQAMQADGISLDALKVDGGMTENQWFVQSLADHLGIKVSCAANPDTTALGTAYMAGLTAGIYASTSDIEALWQDRGEYLPLSTTQQRDEQYALWCDRVERVKHLV